MYAKSQTEDELNAVQSLDDMSSGFRKLSQIVHYRHALKQANVDLVKHYINGELALILNCAIAREIEAVWPIATNGPRITGDRFPFLILHNNIPNIGSSCCWNQEPVLVRNVQIVKDCDKDIPTGFVRFYVGDDPLKELRAKNVYFSALESIFYVFPGLPSGERGVTIKLGGRVPLDGAEVSVFECRPQIVNSVPNDEGHSNADFRQIGRRVLECLSTTSIRLDAGNVGIWQGGNQPAQILNVFIGPFNFEPSRSESVNHENETNTKMLG
jgi:hypothetical protein